MKIVYAVMAVGLGAGAYYWHHDQLTTLRADVNLVQVGVRVTDPKGGDVSKLSKENFELFIDNVPTPITIFRDEDAPVTAGIVVDNSASMMPKRDDVVAAALAFANASNPQDQMFVVHFSDRARLGLPEGTLFTGDVNVLVQAVSQFQFGGTTALYDGIELGLAHLRQAVYPRRVLLVITDGGDNSSSTPLDDVLKGALDGGVSLYAVGIFAPADKFTNPGVLSHMAKVSGGEALFPKSYADITSACLRVAGDIRRQYTLGFKGTEDGKYHHIRVTAKDASGSALVTRTRDGYFATKP